MNLIYHGTSRRCPLRRLGCSFFYRREVDVNRHISRDIEALSPTAVGAFFFSAAMRLVMNHYVFRDAVACNIGARPLRRVGVLHPHPCCWLLRFFSWDAEASSPTTGRCSSSAPVELIIAFFADDRWSPLQTVWQPSSTPMWFVLAAPQF